MFALGKRHNVQTKMIERLRKGCVRQCMAVDVAHQNLIICHNHKFDLVFLSSRRQRHISQVADALDVWHWILNPIDVCVVQSHILLEIQLPLSPVDQKAVSPVSRTRTDVNWMYEMPVCLRTDEDKHRVAGVTVTYIRCFGHVYRPIADHIGQRQQFKILYADKYRDISHQSTESPECHSLSETMSQCVCVQHHKQKHFGIEWYTWYNRFKFCVVALWLETTF